MKKNKIITGRIFCLLFLCFTILPQVEAEVKVATIFGDHMVLQRGLEIPVWGWADKGEKVTVTFGNQTISTKADRSGTWMVRLEPMNAGGPFEMVIQGTSRIILKDVLVGDVWICGGQSNMEMPMKGFAGEPVTNSSREIRNANYADIRLITVERKMSMKPESNVTHSGWNSATGENIADFSAVGYFFGKEIHKTQNVPVGLISVNWGGTVCETWTSARALKDGSDFEEVVRELEASGMDIEDFEKENASEFEQWLAEVQGNDVGFVQDWMKMKSIPDSWPYMNIPGPWEREGLEDFDGIVWFSKVVELPHKLAGSEMIIQAGYIDDSGRIWFNGEEIGGMESSWNVLRTYRIPGNLVKAGKNIITIRVLDTGGGGGIKGDPEEIVLIVPESGETFSLAGEWRYQIGYQLKTRPPSRNVDPNSKPTLLFNGMLSPLIPYGMKGVIWYQGESNDSRAYQYRDLFPRMINDWRYHWGQGDFPFLFVQLAAYKAVDEEPVESEWAELREAQLMTLSLPNTGMAVTTDIGEADNIHPANKEDVGKRLALAAMKITYNRDIVFSGPIYRSMEIINDEIRIHFTHTGSGLMVRDKYGYLKGFTIAGKDRKFHWAQARIEGNSVMVGHPSVPEPVAVRYAWSNNPCDANLYNKEGMPASPFRTDDWPGITMGKK